MNKKTLICTSILLALSLPVMAQPFKVNDIRVEGLQRVSQGTVYSYLGIKPGEVFDPDKNTAALQRVYNSHLFSNVQLARDGNALVVMVQEFPTISSIKVNGNKTIKSDAILKVFADAGMSEGQSFDPGLLNQLVQSLAEQYQAQSKYAVKITPEVKQLPRNRVAITFDVSEGRSARIEKIDIVGNKIYSDDEIKKVFKTTTPTWSSFITHTDQYNPEKIQADLEALEDYYFDRGFIDFKITNSNMAVSPDKKSLYWTITVDEGKPYEIVGYNISGDTVVPQAELDKLVKFKVPSVYDRSKVSETLNTIKTRLGDEGYALADVVVTPDVDPLTHQVKINFVVVPGERMYVRHINFAGNDKTYDRVLRRELRQQESSVFSATDVARSEQRLRRLPQVGQLEQEVTSVPGQSDQVDITYKIKEQNTSFIQGGVGYGKGSGALFNLQYGDNNFFGTGNQLNLAFGKSGYSESYDFNFIDPYFTADGISANYSLSYSKYNFDKQELSNWAADNKSAFVTFGYPLSEYNKLYFGAGYRGLDIKLGSNVAKKIKQYIDDNGKKYHEFILNTSWARDTLNTAILPTKGMSNRINAEIALPGSSKTYYKLNLKNETFIPLGGEDGFAIGLHGDIGLGKGYGKTETLPFFRNYYAGGIGSIRGYQFGAVGPHYANGDSAGGELKVTGGAQLFFPRGFGDQNANYRVGTFVDFGSAYKTPKDFSIKDFRYSAGVSLEWLSPIGLLNLSYARPINKKKGDKLESFQFTVGTRF